MTKTEAISERDLLDQRNELRKRVRLLEARLSMKHNDYTILSDESPPVGSMVVVVKSSLDC